MRSTTHLTLINLILNRMMIKYYDWDKLKNVQEHNKTLENNNGNQAK